MTPESRSGFKPSISTAISVPNIYAPVSDVGTSKKIPWIEVRDKHNPGTKLSELGYGQVKVWDTNRIAITAPETAHAYGWVEDIMGSTK